MWNLILVHLETVLVSVLNEIVLDAHDGLAW
jgi:hypothetical protein